MKSRRNVQRMFFRSSTHNPILILVERPTSKAYLKDRQSRPPIVLVRSECHRKHHLYPFYRSRRDHTGYPMPMDEEDGLSFGYQLPEDVTSAVRRAFRNMGSKGEAERDERMGPFVYHAEGLTFAFVEHVGGEGGEAWTAKAASSCHLQTHLVRTHCMGEVSAGRRVRHPVLTSQRLQYSTRLRLNGFTEACYHRCVSGAFALTRSRWLNSPMDILHA